MANKKALIEYEIDFNRRRNSGSKSEGEKSSVTSKSRHSLAENLTSKTLIFSSRPVSPSKDPTLSPKKSLMSPDLILSTRPQAQKGVEAVDSFARAMNGMYRDIEKFKKQDYSSILQPTWDKRFTEGKTLTTKDTEHKGLTFPIKSNNGLDY